MTEPIDQATKVMSNTDGEGTQKVSLGELLLNAGTRIVDLEKQSNDQVEIITHLEKQLASLREQLDLLRRKLEFSENTNKKFSDAHNELEKKLQQKEDENRELKDLNKELYSWLTIAASHIPEENFEEVKQSISRLSAKLGKV